EPLVEGPAPRVFRASPPAPDGLVPRAPEARALRLGPLAPTSSSSPSLVGGEVGLVASVELADGKDAGTVRVTPRLGAGGEGRVASGAAGGSFRAGSTGCPTT